MPNEEGKITIIVCDDHKMITDLLEFALKRTEEFEMVVPPILDPTSAIAACEEHHPDVVLMDVRFPGQLNGIDATRRIKELSPESNVVVMTAVEDERLLLEAVEAGASGFLRKAEALDLLVDTVKGAARGELMVDSEVLARLMREAAQQRRVEPPVAPRFERLSPREREILTLLAAGKRNDDIATQLDISAQTVQTHVRNMLSKLGVRSRLEAVMLAARSGIVEV
jgi:DNA-binding NarL/FixJ family response regulator